MASQNILISFVVPVYNSEAFIRECLESLVEGLRDISSEVIIINDGSQDNSKSIIQSFIKNVGNNINFIFIDQENKGPGYARNRALGIARGKYISFLDSDDILIEGFNLELKKLIADKFDYDIIEHGFIRFKELSDLSQADYSYTPLYNFKGKYNLGDVLPIIFARTVWFPSIRIFKRELWDEIRFPEEGFYEDPKTIYKLFLRAKNIFFLGSPLLGYRINHKSITQNHSAEDMKDLILFFNEINDRSSLMKIYKLRLARTISYFFHEFVSYKEDYLEIRKQVSYSISDPKTLRALLFVDLLFLFFPFVYDILNKIRIGRK